MKNKGIYSYFILFFLCLSLAGCGGKAQRVEKEDISLTLPKNFEDVSLAAYAQDLDFLFNGPGVAVSGIREEKSDFVISTIAGLQSYSFSLAAASGMTEPPDAWEMGYTFSYKAIIGGEEYTYLIASLQTEDAFWALQGYCLSGDFGKYEPILWEIFTSAKSD